MRKQCVTADYITPMIKAELTVKDTIRTFHAAVAVVPSVAYG
jgi:hypothetical protein